MSTLWNVVQYLPGVTYAGSYFWPKKDTSHSLGSNVFHNILDYLPPREIVRCSKVSTHWHWMVTQFPQQLTLRKIREIVGQLSLMGNGAQEKNTEILCHTLQKYLTARALDFPLSISSAHHEAYVDMFRKFTKFLTEARWNASRLLDVPLTEVSKTFTEKLVQIQCEQHTSAAEGIYLLFKRSVANKKCIPESMEWKEFQRLVDVLECRTLGSMLIKAYESTDPQDTYCFVVLLKMAFQQSWELPPPELACKKIYLEKTLFLKEPKFSTFLEIPRFLELVLFRRTRGEKREFYEHVNDTTLFKRLFAKCVMVIPPSTWKNKGETILDFFETFHWDTFWKAIFQSARDPLTQQMGLCFTQFFQNKASPREKTEQLNRLEELLPNSKYTLHSVFGHLHFPLHEEERPWFFPACVRPLSFHPKHPVIHCGNICIGITHQWNITALCAYDKKTEKLLWELHPIDLFSEANERPYDVFYCQKSDSELALMHHCSSQLLLINAADGTIKYSVAMPGSPINGVTRKEELRLYFSPCGFVYYKAMQEDVEMLFCGQIATTWQTHFQIPSFLTLSGQGHFASLYSPFDSTWTIVDKSGSTSVVTRCHSLRIKRNYLYTLDETGRLTRQTLQPSEERFLPFGPKQSIVIEERPSFCQIRDICDDGTVVCSAERYETTTFYFISFGYMAWKVLKKEIASFHLGYFVDTKNTVLWTWDKAKKEIETHSITQSKKMDPMAYTGDLQFLYVDDKNRLLCVKDYH